MDKFDKVSGAMLRLIYSNYFFLAFFLRSPSPKLLAHVPLLKHLELPNPRSLKANHWLTVIPLLVALLLLKARGDNASKLFLRKAEVKNRFLLPALWCLVVGNGFYMFLRVNFRDFGGSMFLLAGRGWLLRCFGTMIALCGGSLPSDVSARFLFHELIQEVVLHVSKPLGFVQFVLFLAFDFSVSHQLGSQRYKYAERFACRVLGGFALEPTEFTLLGLFLAGEFFFFFFLGGLG